MLRSVISNNQSLIHVKDMDGRYVLANEALERAFSVTEAELIGRTDEYLDPKLAPMWRANDERAKDGLCEVEEWSDASDGRHWYETLKFPLTGNDGVAYATCGVVLDVTERRHHIQAIETARDAAVSSSLMQKNLAASASHELRTPTTSILGYLRRSSKATPVGGGPWVPRDRVPQRTALERPNRRPPDPRSGRD